MLYGKNIEIFLQMQQHKGMIFTKFVTYKSYNWNTHSCTKQ